jgi:simple sugar transport system permease protein
MELTEQLLIAAMAAGTPLLFATLGGILIERSGIIQLGAEGLMLMGAVTAAMAYLAGLLPSPCWPSSVTAPGALHAFLSVTLRPTRSSAAWP